MAAALWVAAWVGWMVEKVDEGCAAIAIVVGVAVPINGEAVDPVDGGMMVGCSGGAKIALTTQQWYHTGGWSGDCGAWRNISLSDRWISR